MLTGPYEIRIDDGQELYAGIESGVRRLELPAGFIAYALGSLRSVNFRLPSTPEVPRTLTRASLHHIFALSGVLSVDRMHIHIGALEESSKELHGGHLMRQGNVVEGGAVVAVIGDTDHEFRSEFDPKTGYDELKVVSK